MAVTRANARAAAPREVRDQFLLRIDSPSIRFFVGAVRFT
jgi:hypothetical protein